MFNTKEWKQIQLGINWLYAKEMILKPTPYRYLKWCGLTVAESLDNEDMGGGDDE